MKAFAVFHDKGTLKKHFAFFDHLKTPVDLQYIGGLTEATSVADYEVTLSLTEAALSIGNGIDMLFLPGAQGVEESESDEFISCIKQLAESSSHVILVGSAVALMAKTELLDNLTVAVEGSMLASLSEKFPNVHWEARDLYRAGRFWSTPGTSDNLLCLALILEASRRGHIPPYYPYDVRYSNKTEGSPEATMTATKIKATLGEKLGKSIVRYRSPRDVIHETLWFIERLAVEGYLDDANMVLKKLCAVIPETPDKMEAPSRRGLEFLWQEAGKRPDVPLERPSAEQLRAWANKLSFNYPQHMDEKVDLLETLVRRIQLGDTVLRPYSLAIAANLAAECEKEEEAKAWLEKQVRIFLEIDLDGNWRFILQCRALTRLILSGFVAQITERTAEDAARDATDVISALETWFDKRSHPAAPRIPLSYDDMLTKLEPRKWEHHNSLRIPPASEDAVWSAQTRLEIHLPEDYTAFLRVSNGMNFMPLLDLPGLRKVEELQWEEASEIGLDEFRVDLGHQGGEHEQLKRILMISDSDSEEMVWFVEPSQIEKAGESGWRLVLWAHWWPEPKWYASFKDYMDYIMIRDEETTPPDEG